MTRLKLLASKNAMLLAHLAAMMIGGGLLDIIYKYILSDYQQAHYITFHLQTAHFVGFPVFASVFVAINLIPFLAILVSLYRITISERPPIDSLQMLTSGLWVVTPVAVAIGAGLLFILVLNLKKSLDGLVVVLKQVTAGRLDTRVKVTANDEIGYVGDVINEMTAGLIERDRMRRSLDLAMEVQQQLLPKEDLKTDGIDIAGKSIYCDETGGDYYDYIKSPILNIIRSHAGLNAKEILDAIYAELDRFRMGAPIEDDITGIVAKINH